MHKASSELLSAPGTANLIWSIADCDADYGRLRPGEFYNHFQNNHELTTKVRLADNLLHHAVGSIMTEPHGTFARHLDSPNNLIELSPCSSSAWVLKPWYLSPGTDVALIPGLLVLSLCI